LSEERGKWKEILISKYSTKSGHNHLHLKEKSWWWRDLSKVYGEGVSTGWFQKAIGWKIGKRDKARFWEDTWVGHVKLKTLFSRLFSISLDQGKKVGDVGGWQELYDNGG